MNLARCLRHSPVLAATACCVLSTNAHAWFLDGNGHYSLRGETETNPGFNNDKGTYQAIEQFFRMEAEAKTSDSLSFNLEMTLFDNPRAAYLGDTPRPRECAPRYNADDTLNTECDDRYQDPMEPGYKPYNPRVTQAHAIYSTSYCLLDVGRRAREWGLGAWLSAGRGRFDTGASTFDGVTCDVNIQKSKTLGFSVGYDKLAETGTSVYNPYDDPSITSDTDEQTYRDLYEKNEGRRDFGPGSTADDMDQFFFTIEMDDRKANSGALFTKNIGIYAANVSNKQSGTDIKMLDLYTGLYIGDITFQNELLFRMGRSGAPAWTRLGGARSTMDGTSGDVDVVKSDVSTIAFAGGIEYATGRSGGIVGPKEYKQGDLKRFVTSFEYAYAPGDSDGYYDSWRGMDAAGLGESKRDRQVSALAFNRNFKPAMILFNQRPYLDNTRVDGVFDPGHFVNATLFALGLRYEDMRNGNVSAKLITAQMNETMPADVKRYFDDRDTRVVGYGGNKLGWELDLNYSANFGPNLELGVGGAAAMPGNAWTTRKGHAPSNDYLIQTSATFTF